MHASQRCKLTSQVSVALLVLADIYDEFVKKAAELANQRKVGNPLSSGSEQGPIVSKVQFDKVMNYIKSGQQEGATIHAGEPFKPCDSKGQLFTRRLCYEGCRSLKLALLWRAECQWLGRKALSLRCCRWISPVSR